MTGHKPIIGLVGGIGSGKSSAARQFESLGCAIIDADKIAKQALNDPPIYRQLIKWWGPSVIHKNGRIDHRTVSRIVFDHPEQLRRLEQLVHPLVNQARQRLRRQYEQDPDTVAIIEDCPLLLEKELDVQCDIIIFIQASQKNRLRRLAASRGWSRDELVRREKNQIGLDIKAQRADYIIDNDISEDDCLMHVRRVLSQILKEQS